MNFSLRAALPICQHTDINIIATAEPRNHLTNEIPAPAQTLSLSNSSESKQFGKAVAKKTSPITSIITIAKTITPLLAQNLDKSS